MSGTPSSPDVRVVIADDHAVVRYGLAEVLAAAPGVEVVGLAADGDEAARLAEELRPDVVLMDLQMPGTDGVEATRRVTASGGHTQVLVLTSFSDSERILAALDAGAAGYLLKDAHPADVAAGVLAVSRGESPLHPKAARELLTSRRSAGSSGPWGGVSTLTSREAQVLRLVREGLANKQVARRLGITERTVKAHLTTIFQRIGVTDRTQAALWAERHDL